MIYCTRQARFDVRRGLWRTRAATRTR